MRGLSAITAMVAIVVVYVALAQALTSPELTARYAAYAAARTAIRQAEEQTQQVQAQQWNSTVRSTIPWLAGGLAVVIAVGVGGWAVVQWQEQRTKRHEASEDYTTQRHLISAKRDIVLAYLVQFGEPGAKPLTLNGVYGAYLPSVNEFVPEDVCRAELATVRTAQPANQGTALARRQPQTINVPAAIAPDDWPPVGLPGDDGGRRFRVIGELEEW